MTYRRFERWGLYLSFARLGREWEIEAAVGVQGFRHYVAVAVGTSGIQVWGSHFSGRNLFPVFKRRVS